MEKQTLEYELEELLDASNVREILEALVDICHGKADHLRANWQDDVSAKGWERDARTIDKIISKIVC